jgi:hypothetical protein
MPKLVVDNDKYQNQIGNDKYPNWKLVNDKTTKWVMGMHVPSGPPYFSHSGLNSSTMNGKA